MDLFNLELTDAEKAKYAQLRSQINIGRAVLHHRLECQLSQAELAAAAETTQARVSEVEAMKGDPKLSTLGRIARALGCMVDIVPLPKPEITTVLPGYRALQQTALTAEAFGNAVTLPMPTATLGRAEAYG